MENIDNECVICYEGIGEKNNCVTPCGHKFCFSCMVKSLNRNDTCPMCRTALREPEVESEDESEYGETIYDSDDDDYDYDSITTANPTIARPSVISETLLAKGYIMEDIISLWTGRIDRLNPRYNQRFIRKLQSDVSLIISDADEEQSTLTDNREQMCNEDIRTKDNDNLDIFERFPTIDLSRLFTALE
jgi:hypothetical protein